MKKILLLVIIIAAFASSAVIFKGNSAAGDLAISNIADNVTAAETNDDEAVAGTAITENNTEEIKNPTFQEVKDFILKDPTSKKTFISGKYECRHFATDVNNNAEAAGIRCAFVLLCFYDGQHAVVGFDTTDKGMVYIEPQTDAAIYPKVGGYYQGQQITEILVCW